MSNLDAKLRAEMRLVIKRLHRKVDTTVVYVTHDQVEAMTLADRIVVMREGRIEQAGPPQELFDRPANLFVAGFIGSPETNLIPGRIADGCFHADTDADGLTIAVNGEDRLAVMLGLRPDDLVPTHLAPSDWLVVGDAQVEVVEPLGSEAYLSCVMSGITILAHAPGRIPPQPEERLSLSINPAGIMLFDSKDGQRLDIQK